MSFFEAIIGLSIFKIIGLSFLAKTDRSPLPEKQESIIIIVQ